MRLRLIAMGMALLTGGAWAQQPETVQIPVGDASIQADLYGSGKRALVLAHGGRFDRKSWAKQAPVLAREGFLVLAISFRGDRLNPDGSPSATGSDADNAADVMAAVKYLQGRGVTSVSAVGGSLGGDAVGEANAGSPSGTFERVVFLGSTGGGHAEKLTGRKLFLVAREDQGPSGPRLQAISREYAKAHEPKKLVVVDGSAHAQYLFGTEQGPRVMKEIVSFLSAP